MTTQELSGHQGSAGPAKRVTEFEMRLPKLDQIRLPRVNWEPVRYATEQVLLTGLGAGVLVARGVAAAVRAANQAGMLAARDPGPVTKAILSIVRKPQAQGSRPGSEIRVRVPVLPIENYDDRSVPEIIQRLATLSAEQLRVVLEYERGHQARPTLLSAVDALLSRT